MATKIRLQADLKEFLKSLVSNNVEYLLIGGYAVGYYGYPRPTGDLDVWIDTSPTNAQRVVDALEQFGFHSSPELFLEENRVFGWACHHFALRFSRRSTASSLQSVMVGERWLKLTASQFH